MGQPAAKQGDKVTATDTHVELVPSAGGPVPTPLPNPFSGQLAGKLSPDVTIEGKAAAVKGSTATNAPAHMPTPGNTFQTPPKNRAEVLTGSATVRINGKPAARNGDTAMTCNDPNDLPAGTVVAAGTVMVG